MTDTSRCLLSISAAAAVLLVLAGCQRAAEEKKVASQAPAPAPWTLDETKLQQPIRFAATDLDPSQSACKDLSAYVNGKWLAANAIPADESGWGAFLVLNNRSLGVRQQLAEHIAAEPNATGIDKIIGDFWATGMDDKKLNELGMSPIKDRLAAIDALTDGPSVAEYLRRISAIGENPLFGFGPQVSPDGRHIALGSSPIGSAVFYLVPADGSPSSVVSGAPSDLARWPYSAGRPTRRGTRSPRSRCGTASATPTAPFRPFTSPSHDWQCPEQQKSQHDVGIIQRRA
jgi:hypothetical protein